MNTPNTYTYFSVTSNGEIVNGVGLVAFERGVFDPKDIEEALCIKPFKMHRKGDLRIGGSIYTFSGFNCEKSRIKGDDINDKAKETVENLKNKIDILNNIKKSYDVIFTLQVVVYIYNNEQPVITFDNDIIEFCYLTKTEISIDMYFH